MVTNDDRSATWAFQRTHSWTPSMTLRDTKPRPVRPCPTANPREKLHPCEIYASSGDAHIRATLVLLLLQVK